MMNNRTFFADLPTLADILKENPGWLDEAVNTPEASRFTKFAEPSLETMRVRGGGPKYSKKGKKVIYTRRWLLEWLASGQRSSTSELTEA